MRYVSLLVKSGIERSDCERKALFYILSSTDLLYAKLETVYNLEKNQVIALNKKQKGEFTLPERILIRLGYNLLNGYSDEYTNPRYIFHYDDEIRFIAYNAILVRFNTDMDIKLKCKRKMQV